MICRLFVISLMKTQYYNMMLIFFQSAFPLPPAQVQKVFQFYWELSGEELHTTSSNRAAPEAPVYPRSAQREASAHSAQRPHWPHQEEEGREGYVYFVVLP